MRTITLTRRNTVLPTPRQPTYGLDCEITSAQGITKAVFVKLRLRSDQLPDSRADMFHAVATPIQLESLDENTPRAGAYHYRSASIQLRSGSASVLQENFQSLLRELQELLAAGDVLDDLASETVYSISGSATVVVV